MKDSRWCGVKDMRWSGSGSGSSGSSSSDSTLFSEINGASTVRCSVVEVPNK